MVLASFGFVVPDAEAIVIRDDVADSEYIVEDADYPAIVTLFPPDDCAATLFTEEHLLTVAHCAVDLSPGDPLDVNGVEHAVAEVTLHPMWTDGDNYDIAVVRLEDAAAGVEPVPLYRGTNELGARVALLGRGTTATGLEGEEGGSSDGRLRLATNVVSQADEFLLEVIFESPGEAGITELEGVGASGDSGGPVLFVEDGTTYIAGLNAFGDAPAGIGIAQYGSWDYQTRVSSFADWVDEVVEAGGSSTTGGDSSGGGDSGPDGTGSDGLDGSASSTGSGAGSDGAGDSGSGGAGGSGGTSGAGASGESDEGCGCSHRGGAPSWVLLLVVLAGLRRRRA